MTDRGIWYKPAEVYVPQRPEESKRYSGYDLSVLPVYTYNPLEGNKIRALLLQPGVGHEHIRCSLVETELSEEVDYEAVSYCWGGSNRDCFIECDGRRIAATESLVDALWHFRRAKEQRTLWIDAVCINQDDLVERAHQVRHMGNIYNKAIQVLAFTGNTAPLDEDALDVMSRFDSYLCEKNPDISEDWCAMLDRCFELGYINPSVYSLPQVRKTDIYNYVAEIRQYHIGSYVSLCCLLEARPYFGRLWIWQEIILSKRTILFFGHRQFDWDRFATCVIVLQGLFDAMTSFEFGVSSLSCRSMQYHKYWHTRGPGLNPNDTTFLTMLARAISAGAAVPVDRIYALRGMASKAEQELLPVDYALEPAEVFHQATLASLSSIVDAGRHPLREILATLNHTELHDQGLLPSWIPDYGALSIDSATSQSDQVQWSAGGDSECNRSDLFTAHVCGEGKRELKIKGVWLSKIQTVAPLEPIPIARQGLELMNPVFVLKGYIILRNRSCEEPERIAEGQLVQREYESLETMTICTAETRERLASFIRRLRTALRFCQDFHETHGVDDDEAIWSTLCTFEPATDGQMGFLKDLSHASPDLGVSSNWTSDHPAIANLTREQLSDLSEVMFYMGTEGRPGKWSEHLLAGTDQGLLTRIPARARVGDTICIFSGASTPHVLRRRDTGGWEIVGTAFVYGVMRGRQMRQDLTEKDFIRIV